MKKNMIIAGAFLMLTVIPHIILHGENAQQSLFNYALLYRDVNDTLRTISPGDKVVTMKKGEKLKVFIQPLSDECVYLYHVDDKGELNLVYSGVFDFFNNTYDRDDIFYIPEGAPMSYADDSLWFVQDGKKGTDYLYLVVADKRITDLDALTNEYESYKKRDDMDAGMLIKLKNKIVSLLDDLSGKIKNIQKETESDEEEEDIFMIDPVKPVPIYCNVKGALFEPVQIRTNHVYVKKITIQY